MEKLSGEAVWTRAESNLRTVYVESTLGNHVLIYDKDNIRIPIAVIISLMFSVPLDVVVSDISFT
jgi:hypothetical protein